MKFCKKCIEEAMESTNDVGRALLTLAKFEVVPENQCECECHKKEAKP